MAHDPLSDYRSQIESLPVCNDSWFSDAMRKCRAGGKESCRRICESFLWYTLELADIFAEAHSESNSVLDLVQEANAALLASITTFQGHTLEQFKAHAKDAIQDRLDNFLRLGGDQDEAS